MLFAHVVTSPYFAGRIFLRMQASDKDLFTTLVSYSAGSLTCRLAGSLALAAAALFHGFL